MENKVVVRLDKFQPRPYQIPMMDALLNKGYKRVIAILPRRAGKDVTAFNICIRMLLRRVQTIYYIFPTYSQGRKVLWDAITIDGMRVLDFIPPELIESKREQQMQIRLKNGSVLQVIGSDNYDNSLIGTNPGGLVFSEYALSDPNAFKYAIPILRANDGWALFVSTPRGKNHMWDLWNIAKDYPDTWFAYKLTVDETKHVSPEEIQEDIKSGQMSEDMARQEYWCSFDMGAEGSYYIKYLDNLRLRSQIGQVPWDPSLKVHTAWDIGVDDDTAIIFFQVLGQSIRIIDCYNKNKEGLEHYIKVLNAKPYQYGRHIAPHDLRVMEWGGGITRIEKALQLGVRFEVADGKIGLEDGIEAVRSTLPRCFIDEKMCAPFIKSLENYRQEWDPRREKYKSQPLHDKNSHYADAMRYLCISLPKTQDSISAKDLDNRYLEAMYGGQSTLPLPFRDNNNRWR
jgi:phage terminase large subunit